MMGRRMIGHSGYNPPKYVTDAAKDALNRVECNQYSPTKVWKFLDAVTCPAKASIGSTKAEESDSRCVHAFLR